MSAEEKVAMLVGFIKGVIGGDNYYATMSVESANEIIKLVTEEN